MTSIWGCLKATLAVGISLSAVLAGETGATAAKPQVQVARTYAFSDSHVVWPQAQLLRQLQSDVSGCPATRRPDTLSLSHAIAQTDRFLTKAVGQSALNAFRRDAASHSLGGDGALAFAGLTGHAPALALEALLAAHQKAPSDPKFLISASSILTAVGLPNEALVFAQSGLKLASSGAVTLGVGEKALGLNNEGYALDSLGQYRAAVVPLTSAASLSPYLIEADNNLAEALNCSGKPDKAVRYLAAGMRRDDFHGDDLPSGGDPISPHQYGAPEILDLSAGKETSFPSVKLPPTAQKALALLETYRADRQQGQAQQQALSTRMQHLVQNFPRNLPPLTQQRLTDLQWAVQPEALNEPSIKAAYDHMNQLLSEDQKLNSDFWETKVLDKYQNSSSTDAFKAWCQRATPPQHTHWVLLTGRLEQATRRFGQLYSRYTSGVAANVQNPVWHEYLLALSDATLLGQYYGLLSGAIIFWVDSENLWKGLCIPGSSTPPPNSNFRPPTYKNSPPCPDWLQSINIKIKVLSSLSMELRCEKVKIEASTSGLIGIFGSVEFNTRSGKTTVMVGPKIGGSLGNVEFGAKGGFYVTVDSHGTVSDFGEKFSASAGLKGEILGSKVIETSGTLSLAGAFSP